jgi:hypothetical protein
MHVSLGASQQAGVDKAVHLTGQVKIYACDTCTVMKHTVTANAYLVLLVA